VAVACEKPRTYGYPHEAWSEPLLAQYARDHGPQAGHPCLSGIGQATVSRILNENGIHPHRVEYYLEKRDPEFDEKMAEVLAVF
jgi:hypothetical protein